MADDPAIVAAALELAEADYQHEAAATEYRRHDRNDEYVERLSDAQMRHAHAFWAYKKATGRADG